MKKLLLITAIAFSANSFAAQYTDVYHERETLARLLEQVDNLMPLADLAETQAINANARHRFDYVALKRDLMTIQYGLTHYLRSPLEPRSLNHDLQGNYRQFSQ